MHHADNLAQCIKCGSVRFDSTGTCMTCGYANREEVPDPDLREEGPRHTGPFEIESSVSGGIEGSGPAELPVWRQELSRRLQEIKQRRENMTIDDSPHSDSSAPPSPPEEEWEQEPPTPGPSRFLERDEPGVEGTPSVTSRPEQNARLKDAPGSGAMARDRRGSLSAGDPSVRDRPAAPAEPDRTAEDLHTLIDRLVKKESAVEEEAPGIAPPIERANSQQHFLGSEPETDKLILLTRTFSGLVDLVIVVLIGSALIFAVDVIEGLEVFDMVSLLDYLALLIATFLVYSLFFLATANQTIGMMITDLRITGERRPRPSLSQVFVRSLVFLFALSAAGAGLVMGFFDRHARCLHDRLSRTRVVRLPTE
jgi:uncharacterized RDD family membrane protein YckC